MSGTITSTVTVSSGPTSGQTIVASPYTLAAGSEISVSSTTAFGITTNYAGNFDPVIIDNGTVIDPNGFGVGIDLKPGTVSVGGYGGSVTVGSSGFVSAGAFGVEVANGGSTFLTSGYVLNQGTIINTSTANYPDASVFFGANTQGAINNKGVIGNNSFGGVFFDNTLANDLLINSGTILGAFSVIVGGNDNGTGTVINTGLIAHGIRLGVSAGAATVINAGTIGTSSAVLQGDAIDSDKTGLLILDPGQSLSGGIATFGSGSTLELSGTPGQVGTLANPGSYFGFTTLVVAAGADWTLGNAATISGVTTVSDFGTLNIGRSVSGSILVSGSTASLIDTAPLQDASGLTIDNGGHVTFAAPAVTTANGPNANTVNVTFGSGGSVTDPNVLVQNSGVFGFTGQVVNFGTNDIITAGPATTNFTPGDVLTQSFGFGNGQLVIGDSTSGAAFGVNFAGTGLSAASFIETFGTGGLNVELATAAAQQTYTFNSTGTSSFYSPNNYAGTVAPGYSIVSGEIVTIASGTASISSTAPVNNTGTISVSGTNAALLDSSALTGNGTVSISNGGQVTFANATGVDSNTISFGAGGTSTNPNLLDLTGTGTSSFGGVIANFGTFDTIVLGTSFLPGTETSFSTLVSGGLETLTVTSSVGGTLHTDTLTFASAPAGVFNISNGPNGIVIADLPCFAAGTRILTGDGQVAVEALKVGDKVLTARDGAEAEIVWVGSRTIDLARHAMPRKVRPVRILAGAFGEGLPERDLRLSPDHALFIDGHLIEAKTLVNGVTVIEEMSTRFVTYHHVELAKHDVMLAEGLAAESYLESGNRMMFESDAAPVMLHPDFAAASRAKACAPLATDGEVVVAARRGLLERAVALGFAMTGAIDLTARVADVVVTPEMAGNELLFVLPGQAASVELVSSVGVPAETSALPGDRRVLGVAVTALALIAGGKRIVIALDDPAHTGFHAMEDGHRWTKGAARIALPAYTGRAVLEVTIHGQATRWIKAA